MRAGKRKKNNGDEESIGMYFSLLIVNDLLPKVWNHVVLDLTAGGTSGASGNTLH